MFNPLSTVHHPAECVFYGMEDGDHNHFEIGYCAYLFERWGLDRSDLMKIFTDFKYDFTLVLDFKTISPLNGICYPEIPSILLKTFKTFVCCHPTANVNFNFQYSTVPILRREWHLTWIRQIIFWQMELMAPTNITRRRRWVTFYSQSPNYSKFLFSYLFRLDNLVCHVRKAPVLWPTSSPWALFSLSLPPCHSHSSLLSRLSR